MKENSLESFICIEIEIIALVSSEKTWKYPRGFFFYVKSIWIISSQFFTIIISLFVHKLLLKFCKLFFIYSPSIHKRKQKSSLSSDEKIFSFLILSHNSHKMFAAIPRKFSFNPSKFFTNHFTKESINFILSNKIFPTFFLLLYFINSLLNPRV